MLVIRIGSQGREERGWEMNASCQSLVDRITEHLTPINQEIAALALDSENTYDTDMAFRVDGGIVGSLIGSFREDGVLWSDFQRALAPYLDALAHETQLRRDLNRLQWELRRARHVENLSRFAEGINRHLEMPLLDGLLLRALAQVFGNDPDLWRDFQVEVEK
jgi:hypothetical protein